MKMSDEEQTIQVINNQGIAELIATPNDVSFETLNKHFPFINKVMSFGNLDKIDILDEKSLLTIQNIQKRSKMTRYGKQQYSRQELTEARAYLTASLTLGRDGFAVKRITSSYKNISMNDGEGQKKRGLVGGLLHRRGGTSE